MGWVQYGLLGSCGVVISRLTVSQPQEPSSTAFLPWLTACFAQAKAEHRSQNQLQNEVCYNVSNFNGEYNRWIQFIYSEQYNMQSTGTYSAWHCRPFPVECYHSLYLCELHCFDGGTPKLEGTRKQKPQHNISLNANNLRLQMHL